MQIDDYKRLINRELDGEITPEEEASLMDEVSRNADLEREYRAQHALRKGFRALERPVPAADLARRVADRVLAERPRNRFLSRSYPMARRAAAFLMILALGVATGLIIAPDGDDVVADPGKEAPGRIEIIREWTRILDLSDEQAAEWGRIRDKYQKQLDASSNLSDEETRRISDRENGAKLRVLEGASARSLAQAHREEPGGGEKASPAGEGTVVSWLLGERGPGWERPTAPRRR